MGCQSFPHPKAMLTIMPSSFGGNAVALRLSDNPHHADHGFHPWLSNATAPQFRLLRWPRPLAVTKFLRCVLVTRLASD